MALAFYDSPEKELGIYLPVLGTHGPDMKQLYFNLRFQLTNAYMKTALASKSKRAWRLAGMCITYEANATDPEGKVTTHKSKAEVVSIY